MTRSNAREIAIHLSFALSFSGQTADELVALALTKKNFHQLADENNLYTDFPDEKQYRYIAGLVHGVYDHSVELDGYIDKYAIGWSFSRISRTAIAIMRVAMYEILYMPEVPPSAAINEAVEISKHYEATETAAFVNGILGTFIRGELPPERIVAIEALTQTTAPSAEEG